MKVLDVHRKQTLSEKKRRRHIGVLYLKSYIYCLKTKGGLLRRKHQLLLP